MSYLKKFLSVNVADGIQKTSINGTLIEQLSLYSPESGDGRAKCVPMQNRLSRSFRIYSFISSSPLTINAKNIIGHRESS